MSVDSPVRQSDEVRRQYAGVVNALAAEGQHQRARECAELAVRHGVWRDPLQRPLQYLPSVPSEPVYDLARLWFTEYLEESFERIRAEVEAVTDPRRCGFLPVEEPLLGKGRWDQVIFYEAGQRFERGCALFPVTAEVIAGIPEATTLGPGVVTLSWLHPGTHIVPHCGWSNARLRVHLGIKVPAGASMRVGEARLRWREGGCIAFDDSYEHEVWHEGDEPRVVLLLDVLHPELDEPTRAWLLRRRASTEDRILGYMTEHGLERIERHGDRVLLRPAERVDSLVRRYLQETKAVAVELRDGRLRYELP